MAVSRAVFWVAVFVAGRLRWPSGFLGAGLGAVFRRLDGRLVAVSMAVSVPSPVKPERLTLMPLIALLFTDLLYDLPALPLTRLCP